MQKNRIQIWVQLPSNNDLFSFIPSPHIYWMINICVPGTVFFLVLYIELCNTDKDLSPKQFTVLSEEIGNTYAW